jgi:hypothetical protein
MRATERLPYKVSKNGSYWGKGLPVSERKRRLVEQWTSILGRLSQVTDGIEVPLPKDPELSPFNTSSAMKMLSMGWYAPGWLRAFSLATLFRLGTMPGQFGFRLGFSLLRCGASLATVRVILADMDLS